jgi:uncharacterized damage-inducible protein DinB
MITPAYVRMMAVYNAEMNRRLYAAGGRLTDSARRQGRGAFWGSIHGTLAHLVWADRQWMSRFDGWEKNVASLEASGGDDRSFPELLAERVVFDARIVDWAARVDQAWLDGDLTWWSGAAQRQMTKPVAMLVAHFFNHQTHHRGQAHALITAAGEATGDTDLMLVV